MIRRLALLFPLLVASSGAPDRVVTADGVVGLTLGRTATRVRISPGATAMPVFTTATATRAGLKGGMFGARFVIGPVKLPARTAVASLTIGEQAFKRRVAWTDTPFDTAVDGVIGPGGLPEEVVRFTLGPPRSGERTLVLPMTGGTWSASFAAVRLGGVPSTIRFDPHAPRTVATAAAGVALATAHRGAVSGAPSPVLIGFGVSRPTRTLTLADPLMVGPLTIGQLAVRVADGGAVNAIREADADPDEVRVVGKGKPGRSSLLIGSDQLRRCSTLVFDKRAKQVRLTCA